MNREEAVQQAREWRASDKVIMGVGWADCECDLERGDHKNDCPWIAVMLAAYRRDSLVEELESLAKEMCPRCALGNIPNAALYHFMPIPGRDIEECSTKCKAAPIRARLALLQEDRHD